MIPVVVGCPDWLENETSVGSRSRAYPTDGTGLQALGRFVVQLRNYFNRFSSQVEAIEIWSEPNGNEAHLAMPFSGFGKAVTAAAAALAEADIDSQQPPTRIIAGGVVADGARGWQKYVQSLHGLASNVEASIHIPDAGNAAPELVHQQLSEAAAAAHRRVWIAVGIPSSQKQMAGLRLTLQGLMSNPACAGLIVAQPAPGHGRSIDSSISSRPAFTDGGQLSREFQSLNTGLGVAP